MAGNWKMNLNHLEAIGLVQKLSFSPAGPQRDGALAGRSPDPGAGVVVASEPVWAIGTGEVATPEDAQEVCAAIRGRMAQLYSPAVADDIRVLYGGSVKGSNASGIM